MSGEKKGSVIAGMSFPPSWLPGRLSSGRKEGLSVQHHDIEVTGFMQEAEPGPDLLGKWLSGE